jgi:hypothetical protein
LIVRMRQIDYSNQAWQVCQNLLVLHGYFHGKYLDET